MKCGLRRGSPQPVTTPKERDGFIYIIEHSIHSVQFSHANCNSQDNDLWSVYPLWSIRSLIKGAIFLEYSIYHFMLKKLWLSSIYINQVALIFQFGRNNVLRLQKFRRGKCEEKGMTSLKTNKTHCTNHHGATDVLAVALQKVREGRINLFKS